VQERLDGIADQIQLASGIDAFAGFLVYLSVPPTGAVKLIVTHPGLEEPIVILVDELEDEGDGTVVSLPPPAHAPQTVVRSKRKREEGDEDADETP
jgi:hypothetical protein